MGFTSDALSFLTCDEEPNCSDVKEWNPVNGAEAPATLDLDQLVSKARAAKEAFKAAGNITGLNIDFSKDYILEKLVKLKKEISIIITRFSNNKYEIYEPIENTHEDQILKYSKIPADINEKIFNQSKDWAMLIAEELKYVGTLCVEFFIDRNDNLYVNEIAPRVHNSGHLTINAFNVSQFENHVRAVCGLEQIPIKKISNAKMMNLLGDQITHYRNIQKFNDNEFFFDYLKKDIKEKRKMGHITTLV